MQLWLAVKNVLPLHTLPVQFGVVNMSKFPFANDVLLVTSVIPVVAPPNAIPFVPFPFVTLCWIVAPANAATPRPSKPFPLKMLLLTVPSAGPPDTLSVELIPKALLPLASFPEIVLE